MPISHTHTTYYPFKQNTNLILNEVLHVPTLSKPLLSVQHFVTDNQCFFEFYPDYILVKDKMSKETLLDDKSR